MTSKWRVQVLDLRSEMLNAPACSTGSRAARLLCQVREIPECVTLFAPSLYNITCTEVPVILSFLPLRTCAFSLVSLPSSHSHSLPLFMLHLCVLCILCCPYLVLTLHPQIALELLDGRDTVVVVREENVGFLFQLQSFSSFLVSNELGLPLRASWTPYRCRRTRCASKEKPDSRLYSWYPVETEQGWSCASHLVTAIRLISTLTIPHDMWGQCLLGPPPSALPTNSQIPHFRLGLPLLLICYPFSLSRWAPPLLEKLDLVFLVPLCLCIVSFSQSCFSFFCMQMLYHLSLFWWLSGNPYLVPID